jgi:hypothetical protein
VGASGLETWLVSPLTLALVIGLGGLLRLLAALRQNTHVDEASSVLAAHEVATHGLPLLPAGTPYFQGFTLSLLLSPFVWLGQAGLDDIHLMRLVPVVFGMVTILLARALGNVVTGDPRVGMLSALLVAVDSLSVQWSGYVRMYSLLQAIVMGLAIAFVLFLRDPESRRLAFAIVVLTWLAVFTHVGAATIIPAMGVALLLHRGRAALGMRLPMITMAAASAAPATLFLLNRNLGTSRPKTIEGEASVGFVGDHLFGLLARFRPGSRSFDVADIVTNRLAMWMLPTVVVAAAACLAVWTLRQRTTRVSEAALSGLTTILALYAIPTFMVVAFVATIRPRYLLHAHLLGYIFVAWLLVHYLSSPNRFTGSRAAARLLIAIALVGGSQFLSVIQTESHAGSESAMAWVEAHRTPDEPILVSQPVVAWLSVDEAERNDLVFLAGAEENPRSRVYIRVGESGAVTDYWVGMPVVENSVELEAFLRDHPGAWIVVDEEWLEINDAVDGRMKESLFANAVPVYRAEAGGLVLQVR